jgi:ABC-type transport system involved in multi-copper enzyme maturation permease subunit
MSLARTWEVFRTELAFQLKRPLFWVLILIVGFAAWGLSTGSLHIRTGDSDIGGKKAYLTSMFAQAQYLSALIFLFFGFFVAVAAGMSTIRDEELKVGEILHSTPLTVGEYVWGKFAAVITSFALILLVQLACHALFNHVFSGAKVAEFIGPFSAWNYLAPGLLFGAPVILFVAGTSFLLGEWTRKPIVVFVLPIATLLVCGFFVWEWSPAWLDPRINRALMMIDPAGLRWLSETWLKVDRGVEFYNTQPISVDAGFAASRIGFMLFGLACVGLAALHLDRTLRGDKGARRKKVGTSALAAELAPAVPVMPARAAGSLSALGMSMQPPTFLQGALEVARTELRELKTQPGLYLFAPLILVQTIGVGFTQVGAFDTALLATSGTLAVSTMNTLTFLVCVLLLFYTVESLERERTRNLGSIYYATPVKSAAILFGKALANSFVGVVILLATFVACAVVLLVQGKVGVQVMPFFLTWGLLLVPTFLLWTSFVCAVFAFARNRYTSYALSLALLALMGWLQTRGKINWVSNWDLWSVLGDSRRPLWSDISGLEFWQKELWLNRLMWLSVAVMFIAIAVRLFPRRDLDAARVFHRLRPASLRRGAIRFAPFLVAPIVLGVWLYRDVESGFQGDEMKKKGKDYWAKNIQTWKDAPKPAIVDVVLDFDLHPPQRSFRSVGTYTLVNDLDKPLRQIPVTRGPHYENLAWTLDGEDVKPDDRAGLCVFTPKKPLAPGESVKLGFAFDGVFPKGATKNGGGNMEFIMSSGAVLTAFGPQIVPMIGYMESIGVDEDNKSDAKEYPDDFYLGVTESAFGNNLPTTTHITLHAPEEYTLNSCGTMVSDEVRDGQRTSVWVSDHPVNFFNIIAGKWDVRRGEGTAIYYHRGHEYNVDEMLTGLDAARKYYSEWFHPYPWKELKLSEFPGIATYAQGFPTNITFSEGIGFLTESDPKTNVAFMVTAHESAHQWWGNILEPGKGPNGDILSEGMAHFSTILLTQQVHGEQARIELCKRIESRYNDGRQVDSERPLVKIDGSRPGDTTVTYDKGGWVVWMLLNKMGRENALHGCQAFINEFEKGPDHPVLQDFIATMRKFAPDTVAFDEFVQQWFFKVVVPEYKLTDEKKERVADAGLNGDASAGETWEARVHVENIGASVMPVEIAATRGERFPASDEKSSKAAKSSKSASDAALDASVVSAAERNGSGDRAKTSDASSAKDAGASGDKDARSGDASSRGKTADSSGAAVVDAKKIYHEARKTITLGPGESQDVVIRCDFEPENVLVDPDAMVLQLRRKAAIKRF